MDKKTALLNLKTSIKKGDKFIQCGYIEYKEGKPCYCAIGHIMKDFGMDMTPFAENSELNGTTIGNEKMDVYTKNLSKAGFTDAELNHIQVLNDDQDYEAVLTYIDGILEAEKSEVEVNE